MCSTYKMKADGGFAVCGVARTEMRLDRSVWAQLTEWEKGRDRRSAIERASGIITSGAD